MQQSAKKKRMVGILVSFWDSLFSRAMLGFGSVTSSGKDSIPAKIYTPQTFPVNGPLFSRTDVGCGVPKGFQAFLVFN